VAHPLLKAGVFTKCLRTNTKLSPLADEILGYLREHPRAQDTVEGIAVWWLAERAIKKWLPQLERSLRSLVRRGVVLEIRRPDGEIVYRLNPPAPLDTPARRRKPRR
jgi:hypothetical protein